MKIAAISQPFNSFQPPEVKGSIASWIYQTARRLPAEALTTVHAANRSNQPEHQQFGQLDCWRTDISRDLRWSSLVSRWPGYSARRPWYGGSWYYRNYIREIARRIKAQGADAIHVHNFFSFVPVLRKAAPNTPIILHMHCEWLSQLDRKMVGPAVEECAALVGCSDHVTNLIRQRFPDLADRCRTVPNGFDARNFEPEGNDIPVDSPEVIFVGRVTPEKGIHDLIRAFVQLAPIYGDLTLKIVGPHWGATPAEYILDVSDDPLVKDLRQWYRAPYIGMLRDLVPRELEHRVEFTGHMNTGEVARNLRAATVLANPSLSESFGMSLVEAMACGKPVVATRTGGMVGIVDDGVTGHLCDPGNVESLTAALARVLDSPDRGRALGEAGRRRALENFTWEQVAGSLWALYQDLSS